MKARNRRRGYSLFEVVLVAGVLIIAAAMFVPSLKSMYGSYKLNGAIDSVRAAWATARSRAIEEGRPYRFSVENEGSHYRIAPDQSDYWSGSTPSDDAQGKGTVLEQGLPPGVRFCVSGEATSMPMGDEDINEKEAEKKTIASDAWSTAVVFLPDGTAKEDVRILFQIRGVRPTAVQLRGLTGSVSIQHIQ